MVGGTIGGIGGVGMVGEGVEEVVVVVDMEVGMEVDMEGHERIIGGRKGGIVIINQRADEVGIGELMVMVDFLQTMRIVVVSEYLIEGDIHLTVVISCSSKMKAHFGK